MSEAISLSATTRSSSGRHVHALRRAGKVPGVLYGHNLPSVQVEADSRELERVWHVARRTHLIDLVVDGGKARKVLIRELQADPRTGNPLHADFFAVNLREKLTADVPVVVVGESPAVSELKIGQVQQVVSHIKVECLPADLPAQLTVDISGLANVDDAVAVRDIELPKGVELVHTDPDETVVKISARRVSAAASEETAAESAEGSGTGGGEGA